jgi:hypothetical protein
MPFIMSLSSALGLPTIGIGGRKGITPHTQPTKLHKENKEREA